MFKLFETISFEKLRVCLIEMIFGRMEKKKVKNKEKMDESGVWLGRGGEEKIDGAWLFSL